LPGVIAIKVVVRIGRVRVSAASALAGKIFEELFEFQRGFLAVRSGAMLRLQYENR
jgi:hypothetical protein